MELRVEEVGENCLGWCLRVSAGRITGVSCARLRGDELVCGCSAEKEPLREELLSNDCSDWLLSDDLSEGEELNEDWREGLLMDECREAELSELWNE